MGKQHQHQQQQSKPDSRAADVYVVADGRALTSRRGILGAGAECTPGDFFDLGAADEGNKKQAAHFAGLLEKKLVVKRAATAEKREPRERNDEEKARK